MTCDKDHRPGLSQGHHIHMVSSRAAGSLFLGSGLLIKITHCFKI